MIKSVSQNTTNTVSYLNSGGTGSTAIILSSDGKIVGHSTGQGTNHWVWFQTVHVHGSGTQRQITHSYKVPIHLLQYNSK